MTGPFTAAIFDLDGVIVDTAGLHAAAWSRLAAELGVPFTPQIELTMRGVGRAAAFALLVGPERIIEIGDAADELLARKNAWYVASLQSLRPENALPGAAELLARLQHAGVHVALASASRNARDVLDRLGLTDRFDLIVDGTTVTASKPDPQVYLTAASLLGVDPGACVVFEDAPAGVAGALAAGMRVVGIGRREDLPSAHQIAGSLAEAAPSELFALPEPEFVG